MKKLLEIGNRYAAQSTWKDFALTKFCLCAMGVLIGMIVPRKCKKKTAKIAGTIFGVSYSILMTKVFMIEKDIEE